MSKKIGLILIVLISVQSCNNQDQENTGVTTEYKNVPISQSSDTVIEQNQSVTPHETTNEVREKDSVTERRSNVLYGFSNLSTDNTRLLYILKEGQDFSRYQNLIDSSIWMFSRQGYQKGLLIELREQKNRYRATIKPNMILSQNDRHLVISNAPLPKLNWGKLPVSKDDSIFSADFLEKKRYQGLRKAFPDRDTIHPYKLGREDALQRLCFVTGTKDEFLLMLYQSNEQWLEYQVNLVSVFIKEHDNWRLFWENSVEDAALPENPPSPSPLPVFDINEDSTMELWEVKYTAMAFGNIIPSKYY